MITITRKIQLNIISEDVKAEYKKLYDWNEMCFRAANTAVSHMYFQKNMGEFFYLTEDAKLKFADVNKDEEGLLNTSKQNTTYQVLSGRYKGKMPADIFSNLNAQLVGVFNKEGKEYFSGKRSLRTYRRDMPMPFSSKGLRNITKCQDGKNYQFDLLGIKFKTWFGRDLSGNQSIFERSMTGEYKLCNSSIQLDGKKIFMLAVFQFEQLKFELDADKKMDAELSAQYPIVCMIGKRTIPIGDRDEYLHRRLAIQGSLRRHQVAARYNKNGKGREAKMSMTDRFHKAETHYINTRQHQYTHKLIQLCLQNKCSVLNLKYTPELPVPETMSRDELRQWRKENELLLRNWGYHGLTEKLKYKCNKVGISLEVEPEK